MFLILMIKFRIKPYRFIAHLRDLNNEFLNISILKDKYNYITILENIKKQL